MISSVAVLEGPGHVGVGVVGDLHAVVVELVAGVALAGPEDVLEGGEPQGGGQEGGDAQPPVVPGEDVVPTGAESPDTLHLGRLEDVSGQGHAVLQGDARLPGPGSHLGEPVSGCSEVCVSHSHVHSLSVLPVLIIGVDCIYSSIFLCGGR